MRNRLGVKWTALTVISGIALAALASGNNTALAGPAGGARFKVDSSQSKMSIRSSTSGIVAHPRGLATKAISGMVTFGKNMQPSSVEITVKANSLKSTDMHESASDRQRIDSATRDKILEASTYPNIVFKSTKIVPAKPVKGPFSVAVHGKLTLHGVTRPVVVNTIGALSGNMLRARGTLNINQSDYNITLLSILGGVIRVNDPVKITFDIVAKKA
ncbi:MAG: YceI family protein [Armatimonadota bacterium]|nr:YceI family protein [Armatimonadota bacterium]